jgi:hypothetical protein
MDLDGRDKRIGVFLKECQSGWVEEQKG